MQEAGRAQAAVLDSLQAQIADNTADATRADRDNGAASSDVNAATAELPALTTERQLARANTLVGGSDLPLVALDAYWRAAQAASSDPKLACSIDWWALAGIGRTESNHGRYAGGEAAPDGRVTEPIYGIALDGSRGTAVIRDSDKGALDGDPGIDRAVGVMQFIPSTWKRYGADLSGDGIADPQNVYDGALSAARYLCATSKDLVNDAGLNAAYFSYNHSLAYVSTVLARSRAYQQLGVPSANRRG
ncbi:MAG: lytic transglycosylase domain-containing protein [Actinobacteria bacterium]|nr:lytic transglycosylase domain-containing protein [Actinomycetota bacterium]